VQRPALRAEQGVVHRDIKPANIFLLPDGGVKLLDFGVAKLATSTLTRQATLGSAIHVAWQVSSGNVDGRSDIFSTGIVLYEMLANRKPFRRTRRRFRSCCAKTRRRSTKSRRTLAQLVSAVESAREEPAGRYATAGEMSSSGSARRCRRRTWARARSTRRAMPARPLAS
jgi:serine/threonine-protein kinase